MIIDKAYIEANLNPEAEPNEKANLLRMKRDSTATSDKSTAMFSVAESSNSQKRLETSFQHDQKSQEELCNDSEKAFRKIELLLSVRDRSVSEITKRLTREKFSDSAIEESLERALRCGYLNDDRFAEGFIRSRLRASKGINGIIRDLRDHGIDAMLVPGFPDDFLEESGSQIETAIRLLQRKPPRAKNKRQAAYAKLIRNGYSSSIASQAVRVWVEESEKSMHFS